jgi:hypothetical protein
VPEVEALEFAISNRLVRTVTYYGGGGGKRAGAYNAGLDSAGGNCGGGGAGWFKNAQGTRMALFHSAAVVVAAVLLVPQIARQ